MQRENYRDFDTAPSVALPWDFAVYEPAHFLMIGYSFLREKPSVLGLTCGQLTQGVDDSKWKRGRSRLKWIQTDQK